jgi:hypothetical protein
MSVLNKIEVRKLRKGDITKIKIRKEQRKTHKLWVKYEDQLIEFIQQNDIPAYTLTDKRNKYKIIAVWCVLPLYTDEISPQESDEGEIKMITSKYITKYAKEFMQTSEAFMKSFKEHYNVLYAAARKDFKIGQDYLLKIGFKHFGQKNKYFLYKY